LEIIRRPVRVKLAHPCKRKKKILSFISNYKSLYRNIKLLFKLLQGPPLDAVGENSPSSLPIHSGVAELRQLGLAEEAGFTDQKLRQALEASGNDVGAAMETSKH
jgi:hypothetical protein